MVDMIDFDDNFLALRLTGKEQPVFALNSCSLQDRTTASKLPLGNGLALKWLACA